MRLLSEKDDKYIWVDSYRHWYIAIGDWFTQL